MPADITKCANESCPSKDKCYRYTAKSSEWQYYFMGVPDERGKCNEFWDKTKR